MSRNYLLFVIATGIPETGFQLVGNSTANFLHALYLGSHHKNFENKKVCICFSTLITASRFFLAFCL